MSHVRRQIREAAAAALTGLATTGSRVFQSRINTLRDPDLPCLRISTDDEQIDAENAVMGGELTRELTLVVKGVAKTATTLDDTLDGIAEQVEPVLNGASLGGLVKRCTLERIGVEMDDTLEKPAGVITLQYRTLYFTSPAAPGTAL
jgi:hypothetical protein